MEDALLQNGLTISEFRSEYLLLRTPYPTAVIILLYLFAVFIGAPAYMKDKKPFKLKNLILVYDFIQIILNLYMLCLGVTFLIPIISTYSCLFVNKAMLNRGLIYYVVKVVDLFETVFFVLKKKNNQISFLHVYHHVSILSMSYVGLTTAAAGHGLVYGLCNCTVHTIMYMYYFISAYNPQSQFMKMKKFVTQIQLLQFFLILIHFSWPLFYGHCYLEKWHLFMGISQSLTMLYLFGKFYVNNYIIKKNKNRKEN